MANKYYDSFKDLRTGKYDWKVQARVLNLWQGYTKKGEPFKSFNLLLLDSKRCRIHAFVPGNAADVLEKALEVVKIYLFKNFTVKEYKDEDKFRCILKDIQITFSHETKISDLEESDVFIEKVGFDFYDIGDLEELSKQTTYLIDVIGVIEEPELNLAKFKNRLGRPQTHMKFHICDGNSRVKVTFWDAFAELFDEAIKEEFEWPLIIIIGSGRKEVLYNVKVKKVNTQQNWFKHICTSCYEEAKKDNGIFHCICGPRDVPYPEKWFNLCVVYCASTGEIEIVLENVACQKCYGKHVCDILDEDDESNFPKALNTIEDEDYKFHIAIQNGEGPIESKKCVAKDIISEKYPNNNDDNQPRPLEESYAELSTSTFHLDTMSENN
ncbi:hypothetical protein POM88_031147 [Heracleum sosnowskyi]|uniref:Replication protein A 70 kDa DNA-binding subunit B/D first OB fold domain-containing protein n=1 Tax=Heracleum sosnowskyi TaxID=360622 RepID=A0AAD8HY36_9APIA|nr:hypothetical protein POM88_031147 [Heracleum sosnowskyi]